jgi:hypothetical protein
MRPARISSIISCTGAMSVISRFLYLSTVRASASARFYH